MKNKKLVAFLVLVMGIFSATQMSAAVITITDITQSEQTTLLSENVLVATAIFRAGGGGSAREIQMGLGDDLTESGDFIWNQNGDHTLSLAYNAVTGNLSLEIIPSGSPGDEVSIQIPSSNWFNQILFSFAAGGVEMDFDGIIETEPVSLYVPATAGQWDGKSITFPFNSELGSSSFLLSGDLGINAVIPASLNQFVGRMYFLQNPDLASAIIPEPAPAALVLIGLTLIGLRRKR